MAYQNYLDSMLNYGGPAQSIATDTDVMSRLGNFNFAAGAESPGFFSMQGLLGGTDANGVKSAGWGGAALGALQGLGNLYSGMKQYGLAKDTLNENKKQFELNFGAQRKSVNSRLEDRQRARVASNPTGYQSVADYMKTNGI